jgi:spermidine synthase
MLTLRPGTRAAKGHVVIGGLGLGHQLIEVAKRLQVRRITLVELDRELVEWFLPRIRPMVRKPLEVVVGDAFEVIPGLRADVALIDIFPEYGSNRAATEELARRSPGIRSFWGWGTATVTGAGQRER